MLLRVYCIELSTVLAQDHFYSDFLSLSLTILTHKGSMRMIIICCVVESALAYATGGMNNHTADYLNGSSFVSTLTVSRSDVTMCHPTETAWREIHASGHAQWMMWVVSLNQPKTATIAYIAIAPKMMQETTDLLICSDNWGANNSYMMWLSWPRHWERRTHRFFIGFW